LFLGSLATNVQVHDTSFVVAHFHYTMAGGVLMGFLASLFYWWPKMTGRMYNLTLGRITALLVFIGFNLTFFPQFIIGVRGMPRRYYDYSRLLEANPSFTFFQILSSIGGYILIGGLILGAGTLLRSLFTGSKAPANPWGAATLEWRTSSPPPHENPPPPADVGDCYVFDTLKYDEEKREYVNAP
jgi:cytochrome c oxidase subunit I